MDIMNNNMMVERPFFYSLWKMTLDGKRPDINSITRDDIVTLWVDELVPDKDIADVYGVNTSIIRNIRKGYGVTHAECIRRYSEMAMSVLGSIGASIMKV